MDALAITEIFEPLGRVSLRRMFGGHGIYLDGSIFAIEADGMIWLKADDVNRPRLSELGSRPFTYAKRSGETTIMSYWAMPDAAFDDPDMLRMLSLDAVAAAGRAAASDARPRRPPAKRQGRR